MGSVRWAALCRLKPSEHCSQEREKYRLRCALPRQAPTIITRVDVEIEVGRRMDRGCVAGDDDWLRSFKVVYYCPRRKVNSEVQFRYLVISAWRDSECSCPVPGWQWLIRDAVNQIRSSVGAEACRCPPLTPLTRGPRNRIRTRCIGTLDTNLSSTGTQNDSHQKLAIQPLQIDITICD